MALETSTYINGLVATNPTSTDNVGDGDNHIRLLKSTIKSTFPNITGAVTATHSAIDSGIALANTATNANTASSIVKRDASGNFSAGAITADLTGTVTGNVTGNITGNVTGDVTGDLTGDVAGDVYAQNGTSVVLQNGTDGTDATFTGKLATARAIALTGDVTGTANFDGSADISISATVADDSHNHTIANIDNLQTTLDAKLASSSYTAADVLTKIKTVDGAGSGLDADLLDGLSSASFTKDSDFTQSLSANGWCKLPNGLMIQWGRKYVSGNQANVAQSFPTAFPTACFSVVAQYEGSGTGTGDNFTLGTTAPTTTTFRVTNGVGSSVYFRYIAIGH